MHPLAFKAAEAALCAGDQQKYWEMHDRLLANQNALRVNDLFGHAGALGLDMASFQQCLDTGKHAEAIRKDMADGQKAGVKGNTNVLHRTHRAERYSGKSPSDRTGGSTLFGIQVRPERRLRLAEVTGERAIAYFGFPCRARVAAMLARASASLGLIRSASEYCPMASSSFPWLANAIPRL